MHSSPQLPMLPQYYEGVQSMHYRGLPVAVWPHGSPVLVGCSSAHQKRAKLLAQAVLECWHRRSPSSDTSCSALSDRPHKLMIVLTRMYQAALLPGKSHAR
jgi:hypothetical protein